MTLPNPHSSKVCAGGVIHGFVESQFLHSFRRFRRSGQFHGFTTLLAGEREHPRESWKNIDGATVRTFLARDIHREFHIIKRSPKIDGRQCPNHIVAIIAEHVPAVTTLDTQKKAPDTSEWSNA